MKLAVVSPKEYQTVLGTLGMSFHLVDAHQAMKDSTYLDWYKDRVNTGQFIMLDNGAAEVVQVAHGRAMETDGVRVKRATIPFEEVLYLADLLHADEVILPDMKMDSKWTIKHSLAHAASVAPRKRAVVPQGRDWEEWTNCLIELVAHCEPATICVTKDYEELEGSRVKAITLIKEAGYFGRCHVHLLGLKALPPKGIHTEVHDILREHPTVRSLDTGAPIAYAQHELSIRDHRIRFSLQWDAPIAPLFHVMGNIMTLRDWCKGDVDAY